MRRDRAGIGAGAKWIESASGSVPTVTLSLTDHENFGPNRGDTLRIIYASKRDLDASWFVYRPSCMPDRTIKQQPL